MYDEIVVERIAKADLNEGRVAWRLRHASRRLYKARQSGGKTTCGR